ncbi:MAG: hypothetical protein ACOYYS_20110 [Chloroflexota bacterium]
MSKPNTLSHMPPGLALLLLAPLLGELVSGHQGPLEFFNPLTFVLLALPYGFGAVLCRELSMRWGRGRWNIVPLAAAYGLFEEGVVVRSFFNPDWSELGALEALGYNGGIHWWYGFLLIHFHILISIVSSILLTELLYPERRYVPWVSRRGLMACTLGLLLWIPAGLWMTSYWPAWYGYAGVWGVIVVLIVAARFLRWEWPSAKPMPTKPALWFFLLGMANVWTTFFLGFVLPELTPIPFLPFFTGLLVLQGITFLLFLKWSGNGHNLDDHQRFALLTGFLSFFIAFGFLAILEGEIGKAAVSLGATLALGTLWRKVRARRPGTAFGAKTD